LGGTHHTKAQQTIGVSGESGDKGTAQLANEPKAAGRIGIFESEWYLWREKKSTLLVLYRIGYGRDDRRLIFAIYFNKLVGLKQHSSRKRRAFLQQATFWFQASMQTKRRSVLFDWCLISISIRILGNPYFICGWLHTDGGIFGYAWMDDLGLDIEGCCIMLPRSLGWMMECITRLAPLLCSKARKG